MVFATQTAASDPPFSGTIFLNPDIIMSSDPTTFQTVSYTGQALRTMFDRRVNDWINVNAYLFSVTFDDGRTVEIQVNPEFGNSSAAMVEAQKYGEVIGRLPSILRTDVATVWIHKGTEPFGGGNNNLLIHTGQADLYTADGILEETFVHEAAHTSLDAAHAGAAGWLAAQTADGEFISTYARDFPDREDIAESFLVYLAVRYRSDRISQSLENTILQTIPNRINYFDNQSFNMYPITTPTVSVHETFIPDLPNTFVLHQNYPNPFNPTTRLEFDLPKQVDMTLKVYDLIGGEVTTLINESMNPGYYRIPWDARDKRGQQVPSGVYIARLVTPEYTKSIKMVLLK